tara:strand:- start:6096 stop:6920 length:825 start_codon:yes stop_codon:yes gene_type:complete
MASIYSGGNSEFGGRSAVDSNFNQLNDAEAGPAEQSVSKDFMGFGKTAPDYQPLSAANGDTNGESDDTDAASSITNGQLEYVGKLSMTFDDAGLANSFDFDWKRLKQEDDDASTKENLINNIGYDTIINADYETGVTPYKTTSIQDDGEIKVSSVFGWAHGNIQRPSFRRALRDDPVFTIYSVSYSADESEQLEEQYNKGDFTTNIENVMQSISENVHNRMNINMNQDLDFQKNKNKKIGFKKISIFEAQQEDTNISSTSTTSIVNSEMSGIYS